MKTMIGAVAGLLMLGALAACDAGDRETAERAAEDAAEEAAAIGKAVSAGAVAGVNAAAETASSVYREEKAQTESTVNLDTSGQAAEKAN
jgi:uncharacterized lipoprotein